MVKKATADGKPPAKTKTAKRQSRAVERDEYAEFVASKVHRAQPAGFEWDAAKLPAAMFDWQRRVCVLALKRGRCALFLDTGLGKTLIQLAWASAVAEHTGRPVLLLCPLAVGPQTVREAAKFGVPGVVLFDPDAGNDPAARVVVTNYQKLHHLDPTHFAGVVWDESSVVKDYASKTKQELCDKFSRTPYRLACTATPSPNDHDELCNHAELLGVMPRQEVLARFFVHDSADTSEYRLKGHAEGEFWAWVGSWAVVMRRPSDLGFADDRPELPPLELKEHTLASPVKGGHLFAVPETTLAGQRQAKRDTLEDRCRLAAEIVAGTPGPVVVWVELNAEGDLCERSIPGAVQVSGADADDDKAARLLGFADGTHRVIVTKSSVAGFGLNWQHCADMVFVGLSHSYERFYQAVRRCWRFGQTRPVTAHLIGSEAEAGVLDNLRQKQAKHEEMFSNMVKLAAASTAADLAGCGTGLSADPPEPDAAGAKWALRNGDCVRLVRDVPSDSVHYSVFSPPFASLYTYSDRPEDMGNCSGAGEFFEHFKFLAPELFRVLMPGRLLSFHCMNLPLTKERDWVIGVHDFRGDLIRVFERAGFVFHSEVCVWKDPVVAMQRTKAIGLLHAQIKKDSCMSRQGIPDYVVTMRKPGKNPEPVGGRFDDYHGTAGPPPADRESDTRGENRREKDAERYSIEVWQRYASPVWTDIDQTDVLAYAGARAEKDDRHICPLQLGVIRRCLELWTNPGDLVLSPFAGVGSEGFVSVQMGRRFLGFELKPSYFRQAVAHLNRAAQSSRSLLDCLDPTDN